MRRVGTATRSTKIVFVAYQTANQSNGGMESATQIFEQLADRFDWFLMTNRESAFTKRWRNAGATVNVVPFEAERGALERRSGFVRWGLALRAFLRRVRADIIHVNDIRACIAGRIALAWSRRYVPLLMTERDVKPPGEPYGWHWRWATKNCVAIVALSVEMKEALASRVPFPSERIWVINSIVQADGLRPPLSVGRHDSMDVSRRPRIGVIGAFMPKKNQLRLIQELAARYGGCESPPEFCFAGDFRPDTDQYARDCKVASEGVSCIRIVGHVGDMSGFYRSLDAVLVASRNEGLARCMIEALCLGIPVISFDVCSAREFLEDSGAGVVVPQGNYERLLDAVEYVIRPGSDVKQRALDTAREMAARLSPQRIRDEYLLLYRNVLGHS